MLCGSIQFPRYSEENKIRVNPINRLEWAKEFLISVRILFFSLFLPPNDSSCDVELIVEAVIVLLTGLEDDGISTCSAGLYLHLG
jgi:hypothetical protein